MSRDVALHISNKLAGEWSVSSATPLLSSAAIESLASDEKWNALDPLLRVRLLLAPLFLRPADLKEMLPSLSLLTETASRDKDEWVRIIAAAVSPYDGTLHMEAVKKQSKLVEATLSEVRLAHGTSSVLSQTFRPLEEQYLSDNIMRERIPNWSGVPSAVPSHAHFIPREPPEVVVGPPLSQQTRQLPTHEGHKPSISTTDDKSTIPPPLPRAQKSSLKNLYAQPGKGGARFSQLKPKKAAIIDVSTVSQLNKAAAMEKAKKQREEEEAKEEAARAKLAAKAAEKAAKLAAKEEAKEKKAQGKKSQSLGPGEKDLTKSRKRPLLSDKTPGELSEPVTATTRGESDT